jgi:hypothetical protein
MAYIALRALELGRANGQHHAHDEENEKDLQYEAVQLQVDVGAFEAGTA